MSARAVWPRTARNGAPKRRKRLKRSPAASPMRRTTAGFCAFRGYGDDMTDGNELSALFAKWAEGEGILARIDEQQCADLARAFMAGYTHGRMGNAEKIELVPLTFTHSGTGVCNKGRQHTPPCDYGNGL